MQYVFWLTGVNKDGAARVYFYQFNDRRSSKHFVFSLICYMLGLKD